MGIWIALGLALLLMTAGIIFREEISGFFSPASPSQPPVSAGAKIEFGRALDPSGKTVIDPATSFNLGEDIAWVVSFPEGIGGEELVVALLEITGPGEERLLDRNKMPVEPTDEGVYNFTTTQAFWSFPGPDPNPAFRTFRIKYFGGALVAEGQFTIRNPARQPERP